MLSTENKNQRQLIRAFLKLLYYICTYNLTKKIDSLIFSYHKRIKLCCFKEKIKWSTCGICIWMQSVNVLVCLSVSHRKKIRFANSIPPIDMMPRHNPPLGVLSQPVSFCRHFSSNTTLKIIKHYKLIRKLAQFIDEKFSKLLYSNTNNACTYECRC